jgi:hypothetical protein
MSEIHIYYSKIAHQLASEPLKSKQRVLAQEYLIQGCSLANQKIIDITLSFGANLLLPDDNGVIPLEILKKKESHIELTKRCLKAKR